MARKRYILVPGEGLVPAEEFFARQKPTSRGPAVIGDMAEIISMADGLPYSSNRHYRDSLRAHNCRVVGNDWNDQPMKHDIKDSAGSPAPDIAQSLKELS